MYIYIYIFSLWRQSADSENAYGHQPLFTPTFSIRAAFSIRAHMVFFLFLFLYVPRDYRINLLRNALLLDVNVCAHVRLYTVYITCTCVSLRTCVRVCARVCGLSRGFPMRRGGRALHCGEGEFRNYLEPATNLTKAIFFFSPNSHFNTPKPIILHFIARRALKCARSNNTKEETHGQRNKNWPILFCFIYFFFSRSRTTVENSSYINSQTW